AFLFTSPVKGSIRFERPADATLDKVITFNSEGGNEVVIPRDGLRGGRWSLTFDWEGNSKKYSYKKEINLP
ncbi:MAG TPA: FixH family protein, partial [Mucilaginibacter sp.]|nr:FixH family protein [Mucilaginibacter sp.]